MTEETKLEQFLEELSESEDRVDQVCLKIYQDLHMRRGIGDVMEDIDDQTMINMIEGWHDLLVTLDDHVFGGTPV